MMLLPPPPRTSVLVVLLVSVGALGAFTPPQPPVLTRAARWGLCSTLRRDLTQRVRPLSLLRQRHPVNAQLEMVGGDGRGQRAGAAGGGQGGTTREFNRRMQDAAKVGDLRLLERELAALEEAGLAPDVFTLNALLNCLSKTKSKGVEHASEAFEKMAARGVKPNTVTLNTLLKFFVPSGDLKGARACVERLKVQGVQLDVITSNTLLSICARAGDARGAQDTVREMESLGLEPSVATVTTLVTGAQDTVREMESLGLEPSVATVTTLITSFAKQGDVAGAEDVVRLWGAQHPAAIRCLSLE
ncbi:hypothetical protein T484DRAFT_1915777 [Baffinella frigidus]|nr:hypothetical protein T484DRAFT_1915777 [Cryptophyta sp. CCMP2293]